MAPPLAFASSMELVFGSGGQLLRIESIEANDLPAPSGKSGLVR